MNQPNEINVQNARSYANTSYKWGLQKTSKRSLGSLEPDPMQPESKRHRYSDSGTNTDEEYYYSDIEIISELRKVLVRDKFPIKSPRISIKRLVPPIEPAPVTEQKEPTPSPPSERKLRQKRKRNLDEIIKKISMPTFPSVVQASPQPVLARCDICGKTFTKPANVKRHQDEAHAKIKRFSCEICSYSCYRRSSLAIHMETHK